MNKMCNIRMVGQVPCINSCGDVPCGGVLANSQCFYLQNAQDAEMRESRSQSPSCSWFMLRVPRWSVKEIGQSLS